MSSEDNQSGERKALRATVGRDHALERFATFLPKAKICIDSHGKISSGDGPFEESVGALIYDIVDTADRSALCQTLTSAESGTRIQVETAGRSYLLELLPSDGDETCCSVLDLTLKRELLATVEKLRRLETVNLVATQVAHDLNNKLTILVGNLSLLQFALDDAGVDTSDNSLGKVEQAAQDAKELVARLHAMADDDVGGSMVDLGRVVTDVIDVFAQHGMPCELVARPDRIMVRGSSHELYLALAHMVLNGFEAGAQKVELNVERVVVDDSIGLPLDHGAGVVVTVTDDGEGISEDAMKRVFQACFSTKEGAEGIGLTIARSVATRHGGALRVHPSPSGASFKLILPALEKQPSASSPLVSAEGQKRILVLDDDENIVEVTKEMLVALDFVVITAQSCEEAVNLFRQELDAGRRIDLAVLDLVIQDGKGGVETLADLRRLDPALKAIACSGQSNNPAIKSPAAFGFDDALTKPYTVSKLAAAVQNAL